MFTSYKRHAVSIYTDGQTPSQRRDICISGVGLISASPFSDTLQPQYLARRLLAWIYFKLVEFAFYLFALVVGDVNENGVRMC